MPHSIDEEQPAAVDDEPTEDLSVPAEASSPSQEAKDVTMGEGEPAMETLEPEAMAKIKLEDLFDDVLSDEEFPSSAPVKEAPPSSPPNETPGSPV